MHVDLALFQGDELLERAKIMVGVERRSDSFRLFQVHHQILGDAADVVLDSFSGPVDLKRVALTMPIHESQDWESIALGKFTLAFRCRVNA